MKMVSGSDPLAQKIETIGKHYGSFTPLGALKEIRVQHQTFRFNIGEDDGGGPVESFVKGFGRHMVQLPGRLRDDFGPRYRFERVNKGLRVVEYLHILARRFKRRLNVLLSDVDAPVADVPDA